MKNHTIDFTQKIRLLYQFQKEMEIHGLSMA